MSTVRRIYVEKKPEYAVKAKELFKDIKGYLGINSVTGVRYLIRYDVEIFQMIYLKRLARLYFPSLP